MVVQEPLNKMVVIVHLAQLQPTAAAMLVHGINRPPAIPAEVAVVVQTRQSTAVDYECSAA
jgi:hypothetical protein